MISPRGIQEFLAESDLQLWMPANASSQRNIPIQIKGLDSLLHLPRVPVICLFPADLPSYWSSIQGLFENILRTARIAKTAVLFGDEVSLNACIGHICSRTSAKKVLSFGVGFEGAAKHEGCSYISSQRLDEVIKNPLLKKEVWTDVSVL